jgi:anti-sigma-K factor RskA
MVELGQPWDEAARAVGLDARAMRKQLERPAVLQLLRRRRQVAREAASAGNIKRLVELRDQSTNLMAATKAVQLLENMGDDHATSRGIVTSPGLVVVIQGANARVQPAKPTIDVEPVRGLDPGRDDGVDG